MFCIEVLIVSEKPLYCLRTMQGNPILSTFELSEVQQKIADADNDFVEKSKNMKTNSDKS